MGSQTMPCVNLHFKHHKMHAKSSEHGEKKIGIKFQHFVTIIVDTIKTTLS